MSIRQLGVFLCTLYVIPCMVRADLGLPSVQAVCEVRLKDGTAIEGVVLVATGGYVKQFDTNGFLLHVKPRKLNGVVGPNTIELGIVFDPEFYAIQPYEGIVEMSPRSQRGWGPWFDEPKVYFLRNVTYGKYFTQNLEVETEYDSTGSPVLLKRDLIDHRIYELLDYVPIYTKVPEELYLAREITSVKQLRVRVDNIQRFALIFEPSQRWLDEIAATEKTFKETHDMFEVLLPIWWHDIINKQEDYKDLFKKWDFWR